jgi:uncharacterized repeat protein (TIGR01451 family)
LEHLEDRLAPATYAVNDPGSDGLAGPDSPYFGRPALTDNGKITLVSAVAQNTLDNGGDVILVGIEVTINGGLGSPVPVTIQGLSQDNQPLIHIDSHADFGSGSFVSGLVVTGTWIGAGGGISVGSDTTVESCTVAGGHYLGIRVLGNNTTIRNCVVFGNGIGGGILIVGDGNTVVRSKIGTDASGSTAEGNQGAGVTVHGSNNRIGGPGPDGNVISGNFINLSSPPMIAAAPGIRLEATTSAGITNNVIEGNFIGTNANGTAALGNTQGGVWVDGAANTVIRDNVISGNSGVGVSVASTGGYPLASGTLIQGNRIGTDKSGTIALPNGTGATSNYGLIVFGTNNTIGGATAGQGNIISGNAGGGVQIGGDHTVLLGNLIGTDASGLRALGNGGAGVDASGGVTIGGSSPGAGNVISANGFTGHDIVTGRDGDFSGVDIDGDGVVMLGNKIGTGKDGTTPLGNAHFGVFIDGSHNQIGGINNGEGNVIAYNGTPFGMHGHGVEVFDGFALDNSGHQVPSTGNAIRGNSIFANAGRGIDLNPDGIPFAGTDIGTAPFLPDAPHVLNPSQRYNRATQRVYSVGGTAGPNHQQTYPVYLGRDEFGLGHWQLNSTPNHHFEIDFYSNPMPNRSGFGDGQTLLTSVGVTTDANGHKVFETPLGVDGHPYVSTTATDDTPGDTMGDTSQFSMVNTSGDGIADAWKMWGIDFNEDGTPDLMLPDHPNVNERDIYVEIDAMENRAPLAAALQLVTQAFANQGIVLHLQLDDTNLPLPAAPWLENPVTQFPLAEFDTLKSAWFGTASDRANPLALAAKRLVYRYCIFADTFRAPNPAVGNQLRPVSGVSEMPFPSNDFAVCLGPFYSGAFYTVPVEQLVNLQAGTFMHELGHTLGLQHQGGGTKPDGSPVTPPPANSPIPDSYVSVMNYTYQDGPTPGHPFPNFPDYGPQDWSQLLPYFLESPDAPDGVHGGAADVDDFLSLATADLALSVTARPDAGISGQPLTLTFTVANNGPAVATEVVLTDTLPPGTTVVSVTPTQGTFTQAMGTITVSLGTLANGSTATITLVIKPTMAGSLTNTAQVTANEADPTPADNTATTTIMVTGSGPGTNDDALFIAGLYQDLLGRAPDPGGLAGFQQAVDVARAQVLSPIARQFVTSTEYRLDLVNGYYTTYLRRPAGAGEVAGWLAALQQGMTTEQVLAAFLGSDEDFQKDGGTNGSWLDQVYQDLLLRARDPDSDGFLAALDGGTHRQQVATDILDSTEYRTQIVTRTYAAYLGRQPGPAELQLWLPLLGGPSAGPGTASPDEQFRTAVLASEEYFQKSGSSGASWVQSLYSSLFGRSPDQPGFENTLTGLLAGYASTRGQVSLQIQTSAEYRSLLVDGYYTKFLGRSASPVETDLWASAMQNGRTAEDVLGAIVSSEEYFQRQGGTNAGWLDRVYLDLLGRGRDPGSDGFLAALNGGTPRQEVAAALLDSVEYRTRLVGYFYNTDLRRAGSPDEIGPWVQALAEGKRDEEVLAAILASEEYFQQPRAPRS